METFVAASSAVLFGIVGYLFWLGVCQRKLSREMEAMQAESDHQAAGRSSRPGIAA